MGITEGCPNNICKGYELMRNLDFNDDASYSSTANRITWTTGEGWQPIGDSSNAFTGQFEGNGHTISNLTINRGVTNYIGLFGSTGNGAEITNVGLLNVNITGNFSVGGLVGGNGGSITNSHATGDVFGGFFFGGGVGGLVGRNDGSITNSYATGSVSGSGSAGGLVGLNFATITNSYATGDVGGEVSAGGLVGVNGGFFSELGLIEIGTITNSYATGDVFGGFFFGGGVGGLVGRNDGSITNSYATGEVGGEVSAGGLVGLNGGTITNSYWDITTSRIQTSAGGTGKTMVELIAANAQNTDPDKPYYEWSTTNWDFGTGSQYPILKYTDNPNTDSSECRSMSDTTTDLPVCGSLLSPILRYGLSELQLVAGNLLTDFDVLVPSYRGTVVNSTSTIRFRPITVNPDAKVYIMSDEEARGTAIASGNESGMISLNTDGITTITIVVENGGETTPTVIYTLYLNYNEVNDVDRDDDGLIEIDNLEELNAMRYEPDGTGYRERGTFKVTVGCPNDGCRGYELTRDLDFNDDDSYSSTANRIIWTTGEGWQPINVFFGKFEGNDFTISNLTIDRSGTSRIGLFGRTGSGAEIANVGLLNVNITGSSDVGGLVGDNDGIITNGYATGFVEGSGDSVGGLVGGNGNGGIITNSYATSSVSGSGSAGDVGGLVGDNGGIITNGYATGFVEGSGDSVGGLVGDNGNGGIITNSYAAGSVSGSGSAGDAGGLVGDNDGSITNGYATGFVEGSGDSVGGLVGDNGNGGIITNSYAAGSVSGSFSFGSGGLVGRNDGTITNSYWDINTSGIQTSAGGRGGTTQQLQAATDTGSTPGEIYYNWSTDDWDFGTSIQYPVLKYTDNPNTDSSECRNVSDTTTDLPVCGSLLSPILRYGLSELQLVAGNLSPDFDVVVPSYRGTLVNSTGTIRFRPITVNPDAKVYITADEEARGTAIASGNESGTISLNTDGITTITIEVENGGETIQTIIYTLSLNYYEFNGDVDRDNDGLIEIDNLEGLNAMRYQPDGTSYRESETALKVAVGCPNNGCKGYELTRDLDFNDDDSYSSTANRIIWTAGAGWQPIGDSSDAFTGKFEGNDHTISDLTIDRSLTTEWIGLFGYTGSDAEIANVGLLSVDIMGTFNVGGLVGRNDGSITNSYATGSVEGSGDSVGSLVGSNDGSITNSYATGFVEGSGDSVGGLVGGNGNGGIITNSYATSSVSGSSTAGGLVGRNGGSVTNSYATGDVFGSFIAGGLVGGNGNGGIITNSYATGSVSGSSTAGGLVGGNDGTITNSYATGSVSGSSTAGGLVGGNGGSITNSYATGSVSGGTAGGLVGVNGGFFSELGLIEIGTITNSYATGSVSESGTAGGLVGGNDGTITNSYATGSVSESGTAGGLVGRNGGSITNSYATGSVSESGTAGGLVAVSSFFSGFFGELDPIELGTITNSYWDINTSGIQTSAGGTSKTTVELKAANAQNTDPDKPYYEWSITNWDFGTSIQYPVLKYTDNPNTDSSECRNEGDTTTDLPVCGSLLSPPLRYGLSELQLVAGDLSPDFDVVVPSYRGTVVNSTDTIRFRPKTVNPDAEVYITADEEARSPAIASGNESGMISLNTGGITTITIAVENGGETTPTVIYTLSLDYYEFNGDVDRDDDGLIEIDNLEGLNAMRYQPDGTGYRESATAPKVVIGCPNNGCKGYELTRDLDFNDDDSYSSTANRIIWTTGAGWQPIGDSSNAFTGKFEGNDHTISDLMIDRGTEWIGLFGYTGSGAEIANVGLLSVDIMGTFNVGGLVGSNDGIITNSYATGSVSGSGSADDAGGLVGSNDGTITNSYATGSVSGSGSAGDAGGLVGSNDGTITNSYATGSVSESDNAGGLVGQNNFGSIRNSYATGSVSESDNAGGLVGQNNFGSIRNSYATGSVSESDNAGGLVGRNDDGTITNSYATGSVSGSGSAGDAGGLVGSNDGTITNSYATGSVSGSGSADDAGGLVGSNDGTITNSYATGSVSESDNAGGLVGSNDGTITNSYATGSVSDSGDAGGLVGSNDGTITNSYATGSVSENSTAGGLVGRNDGGSITNSYATGSVSGRLSFGSGGLVGRNDGTITNSYWDINASGIQTSAGGTSKTTVELKAANAQNTDPDKPYYEWSITNWDFGTSLQYPVLKYTDNPNTDSSECRNVSDTTTDLPVCGSLLSPILRYGLSELQLVAGNLSPDFDVVVPSYRGTVVNSTGTIRFRPITLNPDAKVYITADEEARGTAIASGNESGTISLNTDGITTITIEVENGGETIQTIIYTLSLNYYEFNGDVDRDNDGLIEIDNLEGLNAMRYQPDGTGYRESATAPKVVIGCPNNGCKGYELTRDLDFNDDDSYSSTANRIIWTTGAGWQPIGDSSDAFTGKFEGNDHTISDLTIDRSLTTEWIGLFGYTGSGAEIANVGLLNVNITGSSNVGSLVGSNDGSITNSYATGSVSGDTAGGLVGGNGGSITNSYATGSVSGDTAGGLVGGNGGSITNSYATGSVSGDTAGGLVGQNNFGSIRNSYATGSVSGGSAGGLVGVNSGSIANSYAMGSISGSFFFGSAGGLVGDSYFGFIANSYATGFVSGSGSLGGLVGVISDSFDVGDVSMDFITNSYWDINTSEIQTSAGGTSKTTVELKAANAQNTNPDKPYYEWSITDWDFGTNSQYPILRSVGSGILLSGQGVGLRDLEVLTPGVRLSPIFGATTTHYVIDFLSTRTSDISLRLRAYDTDATIKVVRQGEDTDYFENKGSDGRSEPIPIDANTALVITVTEAGTTITTIYMISPQVEANIAPPIMITPSIPGSSPPMITLAPSVAQTLPRNSTASIIVSVADNNYGDGDRVTLTAISSAAAIVSVTSPTTITGIADNTSRTFTINALRGGVATITFTAKDSRGSSDSADLLVRVPTTIRIHVRVFLEGLFQ